MSTLKFNPRATVGDRLANSHEEICPPVMKEGTTSDRETSQGKDKGNDGFFSGSRILYERRAIHNNKSEKPFKEEK